jgi:hypothetical protein
VSFSTSSPVSNPAALTESSVGDHDAGALAIRTGRPDGTTGWEVVAGLGVSGLADVTGNAKMVTESHYDIWLARGRTSGCETTFRRDLPPELDRGAYGAGRFDADTNVGQVVCPD